MEETRKPARRALGLSVVLALALSGCSGDLQCPAPVVCSGPDLCSVTQCTDGCTAATGADEANCGACGHACAAGETCAGGLCAGCSVSLSGAASGSLACSADGFSFLPSEAQVSLGSQSFYLRGAMGPVLGPRAATGSLQLNGAKWSATAATITVEHANAFVGRSVYFKVHGTAAATFEGPDGTIFLTAVF